MNNSTYTPIETTQLIKKITAFEGINQSFSIHSACPASNWAIAKQLSNELDLKMVELDFAEIDFSFELSDKISQLDDSDSGKYLLYLSDLNNASYTATQMILNLVLDRKVSPQSDKKDILIIASRCDKEIDMYMASGLSPMFARFIDIHLNNESMWKDWAKDNGANKFVMDFIDNNPRV